MSRDVRTDARDANAACILCICTYLLLSTTLQVGNGRRCLSCCHFERFSFSCVKELLSFFCSCWSLCPGHQERVWCAAWNHTGSLLATCSSDKTISSQTCTCITQCLLLVLLAMYYYVETLVLCCIGKLLFDRGYVP